MEIEAVAIGGITLLALIGGLVEFLKDVFGLQGKAVTILSACTGGVLMAVYQALPLLPPVYQTVAEIVVTSLAFGLAASGYYQYLSKRLPKQ